MSARDMFYPEGKEFSVTEERAFAREELVYNVTEDILVALEDMDVNKKELARRLGKSRSYVSQVLSGARNMTLGSLSDICFALGIKPKVTINRAVSVDTLVLNVSSEDWGSSIDSLENDWTTNIGESLKDKIPQLTRKTKNVVNLNDHTKRVKWEGLLNHG